MLSSWFQLSPVSKSQEPDAGKGNKHTPPVYPRDLSATAQSQSRGNQESEPMLGEEDTEAPFSQGSEQIVESKILKPEVILLSLLLIMAADIY